MSIGQVTVYLNEVTDRDWQFAMLTHDKRSTCGDKSSVQGCIYLRLRVGFHLGQVIVSLRTVIGNLQW